MKENSKKSYVPWNAASDFDDNVSLFIGLIIIIAVVAWYFWR